MTEVTRRSLLAAAGVAVAAAGCLTDSGGDTPRTESRERTTTGPTSGTTGDWIEQASNEPDPDHSITLHSEAAEAKTVRVRVERTETGEIAFEATETVESGVELELYNLKEADPEGVETFEVCGELVESIEFTDAPRTTDAQSRTTDAQSRTTTVDVERTTTESDRRDCATIRTNQCYADAHVAVEEDGSLAVFYAIC